MSTVNNKGQEDHNDEVMRFLILINHFSFFNSQLVAFLGRFSLDCLLQSPADSGGFQPMLFIVQGVYKHDLIAKEHLEY